MNESKYHKLLSSLVRKYMLTRIAELLLWAASSAFLAGILCKVINVTLGGTTVIVLSSGILIFSVGYFIQKLHHSKTKKIIQFLDYSFPELENSTDLLLHSKTGLSTLEELQRDKIFTVLQSISRRIQIPNRIPIAVLSAISLAILIIFIARPELHLTDNSKLLPGSGDTTIIVLHAEIKAFEITVTPPAYTGLKKFKTINPHVTVPSGSILEWNVSFNYTPDAARMTFTHGDTVAMVKAQNEFILSKVIPYSAIYQIVTSTKNEKPFISEFFRIDVLEDKAPELRVENFKHFTEINSGNSLAIPFTVSITDDYSLTDAYIIATVSKGSGESVRFREEKLKFTTPGTIHGKAIQASRVLDLKTLGLDPGDELYFYVEASDNRRPTPNLSRTETFFVSLPDTAQLELLVDESLGADLMPEYFRSQRQIIIDSEKLLAEKKVIQQENFAKRSNELGYDQKVLRLRYGQFLGEEFESGMAGGSHEDHEEELAEENESENVTKKFGHAHDHEQEHVEEEHHAGHNHDKEGTNEKEKNPIDDFIHKHDDPEEATFFSQGIRAKLKATLALMWDAELHLRLNEPAKSLPYQYKALKLLKEISQESRIYVHRTGFDAPPLKEDKRLTGDMTELKSVVETIPYNRNESYTSFRKVITMIGELENSGKTELNQQEKELLQQAGTDLGKIILEQPGRFMETLSLVRKITAEEVQGHSLNDALQRLKKDFYTLIPDSEASPGKSTMALHEIEKLFLKKVNP